jgi:hypothetical protein
MAMFGIGPGEKGVSGVPGPPVVLVVPAEVRFIMRPLVLMGVTMLEEPDVSDDLDWELERVGCGLLFAAFGARSLFENKPMSAAVIRGCGLSGWTQGTIGQLRRSAGGRTQSCSCDAVGQQ